MPSHPTQLKFDTDFNPRTGDLVTIAPGIARVTAPNAGPFTFTGTNSFLVGDDNLAVIDPGPDDDNHLNALINAIAGRNVVAILLTHTHKDHTGLVRRLAATTRAPIWFGGAHRLSRPKGVLEVNPLSASCDWKLMPDRVLLDGEILRFGRTALQVIATPGHCANHLAFGVVGEKFLLTGDHVMGWNSTLVATPDGSMRDYFASLDRLTGTQFKTFLPAHGGAIENGGEFASTMKAHRMERNRQILEALSARDQTIKDLLDNIYPQITGRVRFAARLTLMAHLEYLVQTNKISSRITLAGRRFFLV